MRRGLRLSGVQGFLEGFVTAGVAALVLSLGIGLVTGQVIAPNTLRIVGADIGGTPELQASCLDTNCNIIIRPKGTGTVTLTSFTFAAGQSLSAPILSGNVTGTYTLVSPTITGATISGSTLTTPSLYNATFTGSTTIAGNGADVTGGLRSNTYLASTATAPFALPGDWVMPVQVFGATGPGAGNVVLRARSVGLGQCRLVAVGGTSSAEVTVSANNFPC